MRTIKTRNTVKNIKILDKPANLSKRMKDTYVRTKERAEETQNARQASPIEYARNSVQGVVHGTVCHAPNPRHKASEHWNRAKEHFGEVKRNMPKERQRTAEQAQKTANKTKTNAENMRKTADKAHETACDAKTSVKDAKNTLREVRQQGRQTLREVKQSARLERRDIPKIEPQSNGITLKEKMLRFHSRKLKNQHKGVNSTQSGAALKNAPTMADGNTTKGGMSRPNYLDKGVTASNNAFDTAKSLQSSAKASDKAVKSTKKGFKETVKGTVKTAKRSVKTAEQSAKVAVKTAKQTARTAHRLAHTATKTAKAAERVAHAAAKTAARTAESAASAVISTVKIAIAAVKGLVAAVAASGWVAVLVIVIICLVGKLLASPFGVFFSSESGASENGLTMGAVVSQINTEFAAELVSIQRENPHDSCEITANRALWKEILAVYAVRTNTDADNPLDVITLDDEKAELLRAVFWDMNVVTYWTDEIYHPDKDDDDDEDDSWTEYILNITVTGKTADEMAQEYSFNAAQKDMLEELLLPEYDDLWAALLVGVPSGGGTGAISLGIYIWPSNDSNYITSFFGTRIHPITGELNYHTGTDIAASYGTEVLAAADGTVTLAGWNGEYGYCVIIEHDGGNKTLYAHMSMVNVSANQTVTQGQTIGLVGSTGTSTGPHLHLETFVNGSRVDPLLYFDNYTAAW